MEECTAAETSFKSGHPLRIYIIESASDFLVYTQNTSKNIIFIRRIILHRLFSFGASLHYYRDDGSLPFVVAGSRLEPGTTHLKVRLAKGSALSAQARAEYHELPCRELSCVYNV